MLQSLAPLVLLACPIVMGTMMWMMMRGQDKTEQPDPAAKQAELAALQAQIDQLQAQQRDSHQTGAEGR